MACRKTHCYMHAVVKLLVGHMLAQLFVLCELDLLADLFADQARNQFF